MRTFTILDAIETILIKWYRFPFSVYSHSRTGEEVHLQELQYGMELIWRDGIWRMSSGEIRWKALH